MGTSVSTGFWIGGGGAAAVCLWGVYMVVRNRQVDRYRMALVDRIAEANADDLRRGGGVWAGAWRWEELNAVSYDRMVYTFWRPVSRFYARDPARSER